MKRLLLFAVAPALLLACGDPSFDTRRDAAIAVGEAFCQRGDECGEVTDVDACIDTFVGQVCDMVDCNDEPSGSNKAINDCIDVLDSVACDTETLPAECNSVI